jgi:hypothetical protein
MERERMRTIAREGSAYGYGLESGRRRAISDGNERKRFLRDPFGARQANQTSRWMLGLPEERKKKRRR